MKNTIYSVPLLTCGRNDAQKCLNLREDSTLPCLSVCDDDSALAPAPPTINSFSANDTPLILFSTAETFVRQSVIADASLSGSYPHWEPPLAPNDLTLLSKSMRKAYDQALQYAVSDGAFVQPIAVRYALRMVDDTLLYISAPVMLGNGVQNGETCQFKVSRSGNYVTLTDGVMKISCYRIRMQLVRGLTAEWRSRIKAIEIYYAEAADPTLNIIEYHCFTQQAISTFDAKLLTRPASEVGMAIADAPRWQLLRRFTDLDAIGNGILPYRYDGAYVSAQTFANVTRTMRSIYTPCTRVVQGNSMYVGGGSEQLDNKWNMYSSIVPNTGTSPSSGSVLATLRDAAVVANCYSPVASNVVSAMLAVPFPDATSMTLRYSINGKTYAQRFPLTPSVSGEYSFYLSSNLLPTTLPEGDLPTVGYGEIRACGNRFVAYVEGNPFVESKRMEVGQGNINAIAFALKPVTANIFGRFPIYVFATDGIYALSTETSSGVGSRCITSFNTVSSQALVAPSPQGIYFADGERLMLLYGSDVKQLTTFDFTPDLLIWQAVEHDNNQGELMMRVGDEVMAVNAEGRYSKRSKNRTKSATIEYLSQYIPIDGELKGVTLNIIGTGLELLCTIYATRGTAIPGGVISEVSLHGTLNMPLHLPVPHNLARYIRIGLRGYAHRDTTIYPIELHTNDTTRTHSRKQSKKGKS